MLAWKFCDFQGIRAIFAKKPYIFVIFQGGLDTLPPPPRMNPRMVSVAYPGHNHSWFLNM